MSQITCNFKAVHPGAIPFTLSATMTLDEWRLLEQQMDGKWPSIIIERAITDLLLQATKNFEAKVEEKSAEVQP